MKRLKLLIKTLLVTAGLGVGASAWAASYTEGVTVAAGNDYYLYNIGAGKFLDNGVEWNTRATVDNAGQVLTLVAGTNGGYTIYTGLQANESIGAGNYCTGAWMDNAEAVELYFEALETNPSGYTGVVYKIKNSDGNYVVYNENPGWHDTEKHPTATGAAVDLLPISNTNNDYWLLIPKSVRDAAGDRTYLMKEASFNWTSSSSWSNTNGTLYSGQSFNLLAESFNTTFGVNQTISGLIPGKYRIKVKGFYRNGNNYGTNDEVYSYLYATGMSTVRANLPLIITGASESPLYTNTTDGTQWMSDVQTGGVYVPNSTNGASAYIAQGKYATTTVDVDVINTLTLGVKCDDNVEGSWTIFDEFEIEYLGALTYDKTITYDFKAIATAKGATTTLSKGTLFSEKNNSNSIYYPNEFTDEFGKKFAFQFRDGDANNWSVTSSEGLYSSGQHDDYFSVLNLKAGDAVKFEYEGTVYFSTTTANCVSSAGSRPAQWSRPVSGANYTILSDGKLDMQGKKKDTESKISKIIIFTNAAETVSEPSVSSVAKDANTRTVTITSGVSSLNSGVTTYYTTNGSEPSSSSTKYTGPFDVTETLKIKAVTISSSSAAINSFVVEETIDMDALDGAVLEVTGTNGINRIVTITCPTAGATIYYSETEKNNTDEGWSTYSTPVTTSATTLYAFTEKGSQKTEVVNIATGAGTTIALNAPTVSITALTQKEDGLYYQTIAGNYNPSGVLFTPSATLSATFNGEAVSLPYAATTSGTLAITASYDGYSSTTLNYDVVGYTKAVWKDYTKLESLSGVPSGVRKWSGNDHWELAEGYGIKAVRTDNNSWVQIDKAGMVAYDKLSGASEDAVTTTVVLAANSNAGNDDIQYFANGTVLSKIYTFVEAKSVTVSDAGYATFVDSDDDLDFSEASVKAYTVKVNTKGVATMTKVDAVPAGTPVLLYKEGGVTELVPVTTGAAAVEDNDLVAGTGGVVATIDGEYTNMILNNINGNVGFYFANGQTVAANRAYLHISTTLAPDRTGANSRMVIMFGDDATGIDSVVKMSGKSTTEDIYNLQGQRVDAPQKGLFIVNGKKIIIK